MSCCYNKECVQAVNNTCIAGFTGNKCNKRKPSFNALERLKAEKKKKDCFKQA